MMLLETKRLLIATAYMDVDDVFINYIFLKDNISKDLIEKNKDRLEDYLFPLSIGHILLGQNASIEYHIDENHSSKGYATETLASLRDLCLRQSVYPFLNICSDNLASKKVASKCGFYCKTKYFIGNKPNEIWEYKNAKN